MTMTVYGDISRSGAAYVVATALNHAEPIEVLAKFGQITPMPKNKSETVHWRRPIPFDVATTPLVEGVTPTAKQMQYDRVEVTLAEYGDLVQHTNKVEELAAEPSGNVALNEIAMLLGEQAAETKEMLTWGVLKAGTNVFYDTAAHTARTDVNAVISVARLQAITRSLKANRAKKITSILEGSVRIGTKPVEAAYIAFAHTDLEYDIRQLSGFTHVKDYGSMKPTCPEELGAVNDIRFILSPLLEPFLGGGASSTTMLNTSSVADVYPVIIVAKDAYGIVPMAGKDAISPTILAAGKPSKSDPLGQRGYAGWRTWFAAKILNDAWMARLEVAATKL